MGRTCWAWQVYDATYGGNACDIRVLSEDGCDLLAMLDMQDRGDLHLCEVFNQLWLAKSRASVDGLRDDWDCASSYHEYWL